VFWFRNSLDSMACSSIDPTISLKTDDQRLTAEIWLGR
jgi:hypothetical protein